MRKLIFGSLAMVAMAGFGCAKNSGPAPEHSLVTDVTPNQTVVSAPLPPVDVQGPTSVDPVPVNPTPAPAAGNKKYTVKRGDTLWSIAKANYGDGKQYAKIVSANPGVSPSALKAGQTIVLP